LWWPVFFKSRLVFNQEFSLPNVYQYFINVSKNTTKRKKIVFWPDLVSAHYAKHTLARIEELKIEYVPRDENSPNIPQLRLIEIFWDNFKGKVCRNYFIVKKM
jgi:hypothetical protein